MRITDVDPIDFDLIFERFLNPERVSLPDIDVDFCERRRGEVIDYVTRKYGRENVAQIITFGTMKAKAVVRDVGRALDMPYADVDRIAKQIPPALDMTLDKALAENPGPQGHGGEGSEGQGGARHRAAARGDVAPRVGARRGRRDRAGPDHRLRAALQGRARRNHDAVEHEGGRAGRPPEDGLPRAEHADADPRRARARSSGPRASTSTSTTIPLDDPKTYKAVRRRRRLRHLPVRELGDARAAAQGEAGAPRRPDRAERAVSSRARSSSGMVDDWVARKQGKTEIKYELPQLEPILSTPTASSPIRNRSCASRRRWPASRSDRPTCCARPWGRRIPKVMAKQREAFMAARRAKGVNEKKAAKIFELMEYFAGYGFNKSHSTAYAFLAYQTAYLKANYPWHFAAALLTIEAQNTDKLAMYLAESRERGIPVLPPDINQSQLHFSVERGRGVRFGLTAIKGLGEGAIQAIIAARAALGGRIPSLHALCEILDLRLANKRVFEALVKSGACDSLVAETCTSSGECPCRAAGRSVTRSRRACAIRARLFAAIDGACEHGSRTQRNKDLGQEDLFGGGELGREPGRL